MAPMSAFQIMQGLETLSLRMDKHVSNTLQVAHFLQAHAQVTQVNYPGLADHPDHALTQQLMPKGAGAVLTLSLQGGRAAGKVFIESLELFSHLANIGDAKSLVIHPASTTHHRMDAAALAAAGIDEGMVRISVGLEDANDLIADLGKGLRAVEKLT
jgi:O-acetylhomoserine (thiol)-lyase